MHLLHLLVLHEDRNHQVEELKILHVAAARHLVFEHQIEDLVRRQRRQLRQNAGVLEDQLGVNALDAALHLRLAILEPYALRHLAVLSGETYRKIDPR